MQTEKATFAAGCFWGIEEAFSNLTGVVSTRVGYTGGHTPNPTYEMICSDTTGHAEAVEVIFDPSKITYEQLLAAFWDMHDPTTPNRQGPDIGSQYRSAIFTHNGEQTEKAMAAKALIDRSHRFDRPVVTQIMAADIFYEAEAYHQQYNQKHNRSCKAL